MSNEERQKALQRALKWKIVEEVMVDEDGNICLIVAGGEILRIGLAESITAGSFVVEFGGKKIV